MGTQYIHYLPIMSLKNQKRTISSGLGSLEAVLIETKDMKNLKQF
jgi:hypothetical protein